MPLALAYLPRFRTLLYASEQWMLATALDGHQWHTLELDTMTLSTFDVDTILDFTQEDVTFGLPAASRLPR